MAYSVDTLYTYCTDWLLSAYTYITLEEWIYKLDIVY